MIDNNQLIKKIDIEDGNKTIYALANNEFVYPLSDEERIALEEKYNELPKKEDEDPTNWYSTHTGKK